MKTNKEMIEEIIKTYGAMTSRQIAVQLYNKMGVSLTPAQVAGSVRILVAENKLATSKDARNQNRYWVVNQ